MSKRSYDWELTGLRSHAARLISTPRSKPEKVATSALLAVVGSVDEFGGQFMRRVGGPRYQNLRRYYRAFCEVPAHVLQQASGTRIDPLKEGDAPWGDHNRPDGVIVVSRNKEWRALIEVKVGMEKLTASQVTAYHRMAQELQFDTLVTISNEVGGRDGQPPAHAIKGVRPAQLKKIPIVHLQWRDLLGDGIALYHKDLEQNVADEDQDWILGQWLTYIHDERSEVLVAPCLGDGWSDTLKLVKQRLLQPDSKHLQDVVRCWCDVAREIEFQMRISGICLEPRLSRKEKGDSAIRRQNLTNEAVSERTLTLSWKCPEPVRALHCTVDLDARVARYYFEVDRFEGKSAGARVMSWGSQIPADGADGVVIRPKWQKPSIETPVLLTECKGVRELNAFLQTKGIDTALATPTRMRIEWHTSLEGRSGRQGRAHLAQICSGVHEFYSSVVSGLRSVSVMPPESRSARSEPRSSPPKETIAEPAAAPPMDGRMDDDAQLQ